MYKSRVSGIEKNVILETIHTVVLYDKPFPKRDPRVSLAYPNTHLETIAALCFPFSFDAWIP